MLSEALCVKTVLCGGKQRKLLVLIKITNIEHVT